jgi:hypothetical protein
LATSHTWAAQAQHTGPQSGCIRVADGCCTANRQTRLSAGPDTASADTLPMTYLQHQLCHCCLCQLRRCGLQLAQCCCVRRQLPLLQVACCWQLVRGWQGLQGRPHLEGMRRGEWGGLGACEGCAGASGGLVACERLNAAVVRANVVSPLLHCTLWFALLAVSDPLRDTHNPARAAASCLRAVPVATAPAHLSSCFLQLL